MDIKYTNVITDEGFIYDTKEEAEDCCCDNENTFAIIEPDELEEILSSQLEPPVMQKIAREDINYIICEILVNESGDGHVDGADTITDFIISTKDSKEIEWVKNYIRDRRNTIWLEKYR